MYKTKSMFITVMILGTLITVFSNSWISMWMGLEINMMAFIPLIKKKGSKAAVEASMTYFLVQSVSSTIMMFSIVMNQLMMEYSVYSTITFIALMIKLGAAPFHMWVPEMMSKMKWNSCITLMTWQKLAPMTMTMNISPKNEMLMMIVMMSTITGAVGGINQTSLRKIMAYSSINHLGWLLSLNKIQNNWMFYFLIYSVMVTGTCSMFNKYNMLFINQVNSMNLSTSEKIAYATSMMSLGGLPPFIGFLPKWMVIQIMVQNGMILMMTVMVMFSLITLFYYMRTMSMMMINQSSTNKWITFKSNPMIIKYMIGMNLSLPMAMIMNFI
uniref:NADH dehydrogenase subunit 2 n=1 Tax=Megacopta horvathi TaxID=2968966 RepID=UPI002237D083|nr:NADH dehydrogenase subunit 2 [Megacopta horvathi]UYA97772.1 NADH dehydrogenase subunit 2 [Megacopta horvathi]UYA97785.1 NADH dehydrogenase subunit 2 [Megacopta horvathi]